MRLAQRLDKFFEAAAERPAKLLSPNRLLPRLPTASTDSDAR